MIAITVQMDTEFEFTEGHVIVRNVRLNDNYEPLSDFFQQCVDQQIVLNTCKLHTNPEDMFHTITTYFAVDHAQADKFIAAFSDMSIEFSIKNGLSTYAKATPSLSCMYFMRIPPLPNDKPLLQLMLLNLLNEHQIVWLLHPLFHLKGQQMLHCM